MITTTSRIRGKNNAKPIKPAKSNLKEHRLDFEVQNQARLLEDPPLNSDPTLDFIFAPEFATLTDEEGLPTLAGDEVDRAMDNSHFNAKLGKNLPTYLLRMCEAKLLTPVLERELFRRMNFAKYRAWFLTHERQGKRMSLTKQNEIAQLHARALADRNRIVSANLRLVVSIAKKFADLNNTFDDLLSEGIATLMRAAEKFDYARGFRFSTYATQAVRRSLYHHVIQQRTEHTRFVTTETTKLAENPEEEHTGTMTETRWNHLQTSLIKLLGKLEPRERLIIRLRFGLDRRHEVMTLQSIARELGICKERVRQLEQRAIIKLRTMAETMELATEET